MSDLVERLRWHREHPVTGQMVLANPDGPEAAARIEKLEAALRDIAGMDYFYVCENPEEPMIKARAALEERT